MNTTQLPFADRLDRLNRLDGYLQFDPANVLLLADAFEAAMAAGRLDRAEAHVHAGLAQTATSAPWQFRQATLAIARNDLAGARELLSRLKSSPDVDPAVLFNLGLVNYGLKQFKDCVHVLQPLVVRAPTELEWGCKAQAMWLRALHQLGELDRAWKWVMQAQQAQWTLDAEVCGVAGLLALDIDQLEHAHQLSERALQKLSSQTEALVVRGSLALGRGNAEVAAVSAQAVLREHGEDGRTRSLLGFARLLSQDLPGALANFQQAVAMMSGHIGTWHGLGWTQLLLGDLDAAVLAFSTALEIDRNFAENHGALAVALAMQGRRQEAASEVERALRLDPKVASAQYAQLLLNGQGGDPAAIQRLAKRLLKRLSPNDAPTRPAEE